MEVPINVEVPDHESSLADDHYQACCLDFTKHGQADCPSVPPIADPWTIFR